MRTKFIKVAVNDELPKTEAQYFVKDKNCGQLISAFFDKNVGFRTAFSVVNVEYWLKEVPDHEDELVEIAKTEGILLGLKICKEMWAQGTISHENIYENEVIYKEELDSLIQKVKSDE